VKREPLKDPNHVTTRSDRISVEYRTTTRQDILVLTLGVIGPFRNIAWENNIDLGGIAYTGVILIIDDHWFKFVCRAQYQPPNEA
jgi:hypothetical protein